MLTLNTPIIDLPAHRLPRLGTKTSQNLAAALAANNAQPDPGEATVADLLGYLPMRYEDRSNLQQIAGLVEGIEASVEVVVRVGGILPFKGGRIKLYEFIGTDGAGQVRAFWWNQVYLNQVFRRGTRVILFGQWQFNRQKGIFEIENPEFEITGEDEEDNDKVSIHTARRVPIYRKLGEFRTRQLRTIVYNVLKTLATAIPDPFPGEILSRCGLVTRDEAFRAIHFPGDSEPIEDYNLSRSTAHRRLIFEEFFWLALAIGLRRRERLREPKGEIIRTDRLILEAVKGVAPFQPTQAQARVLDEIITDMCGDEPMNRLLQGDVGSGKTIVAVQAMLVSVQNGYQAALMAPTELLAEQHARNTRRILDREPFRACRVELLTGALKITDKRRIQADLRNGEIDIIVGTHALIQESIEFSRLGLVVIDEQHRFGVLQRAELRRRGFNPDVLVMTATPIPRSLAMTIYGDLEVSVIDELPPGRTPVRTFVRGEDRRDRIYEFIRTQLAAGRQGYVVYPLIEESEKLDLRNAKEMYDHLQREIFPEFRLGILHGRMKPAEKEEVMSSFSARAIDLLVATTVVEVGIDVPNATVMLIEHAERFGLSQLHQLRGRVGRGGVESFCILLSRDEKTRQARQRLKIMEETSDGFLIAEKDLELRGSGEIMGTRQSGLPIFRVANLVRDQSLLELARTEANQILALREMTPDADQLIQHLRRQTRFGLARIG